MLPASGATHCLYKDEKDMAGNYNFDEPTGCKTRNDGVHGVWRYSNPNKPVGSVWTEANTKEWDSICSGASICNHIVPHIGTDYHATGPYKRCAWYP